MEKKFDDDDDNDDIDEEKFGRMPRLFSKILFFSENWKSYEKKSLMTMMMIMIMVLTRKGLNACSISEKIIFS